MGNLFLETPNPTQKSVLPSWDLMNLHHPTDYHSQLREMIVKVRKEKKLTDLFDIVDEAQKRLRNE